MRLACTHVPARYSADVVCIPGATAFPPEWVPLLREYEHVWVFADSDEPGLALPNRLASLVPGVRRIVLPDGYDVCSFLLEHDEDDLALLVEVAPVHVPPPAPIRAHNLVWDDAASRDHRDKLARIVSEDVALRPKGNEFVGLCPFHDDTSPSFSVNPTKGLYRCFSCGASGDVITYLRNRRDFSFGEAMKYLREYT